MTCVANALASLHCRQCHSICSEIAPLVEQLHLYQRTANWVVPKGNDPYTEEQLEQFRRNPELVQASRQEIYNTWNTLCTFNDKKVLGRN